MNVKYLPGERDQLVFCRGDPLDRPRSVVTKTGRSGGTPLLFFKNVAEKVDRQGQAFLKLQVTAGT